jgi:hypothetical protein
MNEGKNLDTAQDMLSSTYLGSFLMFLGRTVLKTFRMVFPVLVLVCGVCGTENRVAELKKCALTRRSGCDAVPSSCCHCVLCGVWCW